ncbi:hypothetical protein [Ligilactobacillus saerimneri]|uniref:Sulfotransferase domain-containing protein n=1 Tax=Ligilactobacillus saerimneri 30a TaxID=1227363 RepID=M5J7M8_9LACO|nr:hypothetical protein [Ligilactobacillus saerimneri]EKW98854.1 hypothetical protein D271_04925 [Ligilactobacillus saerimneri 30a]
MRFISCASYYGTGSSAITDFVSEFDDVFSFTNEEFRFIQDPDGISDLEFNLVECFNRHNSGHALKRYKRLVDFYSGNILGRKYSLFFGEKWQKYSYEYIDKLTDFTFPGWWQYDLYDRGQWFYFRKRILNKILHKTIWKNKPELTLNTMKNEITYASHPSEEKFLMATRKYIESLFSSVIPDGYHTMMVDQLLPPMNLQRYLRYFNDNMQVVVVDRDPRDVFVLDKYVWKDGVIPNDVETFCKWYRYTRSHRKTENMDTEQVKFIRFEDLVYRYDETTDLLIEWLNLDKAKHTQKRKIFNPDISRKNTKVWQKFPEAEKEVAYISERLTEYLYSY